MKRVCIMVGHYGSANITQESLRTWRSAETLQKSTGASGEADYHWNKIMPLLRDKLIQAGVEVHIAPAYYQAEVYSMNYDLFVALHYDGGGTVERCMISAPNRATVPAYLHETAQGEAERFCSIWKSIYPDMVGVPFREDFITDGMKDYYGFDYVPYDTPAVIIEHFNHTSPQGTFLKEHPEIVADADFKSIMKFLGMPEQPPVINPKYQIVYKGGVLQEYDVNPSDTIASLSTELENTKNQVASLTSENGTLKADLQDAENTASGYHAELSQARQERDDAKAALGTAEDVIKKRDSEIARLGGEVAVLNTTIERLKSSNPLDAFGGWELIAYGLKKVLNRK